MSCLRSWKFVWALFLLATVFILQGIGFFSSDEESDNNNNGDHSRQKRLLFFSHDRLLSFPEGTTIFFDFTFSTVGIRNLPTGYGSSITLSTGVPIELSDLGLTPGDSPFFFFPYVDLTGREFPGVNRAGGDRLFMYEYIEDMLESIGMNGKPCLLRAICELFEVPLLNHGFIGEILELFLSPSRSPYAEVRLGDYAIAEREGRKHGNCSIYNDACLHSLFFTYVTDEPKLIPVSDESRQKRFIYFTRERRLTFPPGSSFFFAPGISIPVRAQLPVGYTVSVFQINPVIQVLFDDLGLTSDENPWGLIEGLDELNEIARKRRETITRKSDPKHPGGDRDMFYHMIEDTLHNFGMNGKACMLRAICEMFQYPLDNHGFFGEFLELFFSASRSHDADKRLPEYSAAERTGRTSGDCSAYLDACPISLFTNPLDPRILNETKETEGAKKQSTFWSNMRGTSLFNTAKLMGPLFQYLESWI